MGTYPKPKNLLPKLAFNTLKDLFKIEQIFKIIQKVT